MFYLQSRWKLEGKKLYYYGLRNRENLFRNQVSVSKKERIGIKCIRCLRCVSNCPQGALEFTLHPILKAYLQKERKGL